MNYLMNTPLLAFGIPSGPDMLVIAVLVLVLFGAKKLPVFARSLGRSMGEFRKAKEEFEHELNRSHDDVVNNKDSERRIESPKAAEAKPAEPVAVTQKEV